MQNQSAYVFNLHRLILPRFTVGLLWILLDGGIFISQYNPKQNLPYLDRAEQGNPGNLCCRGKSRSLFNCTFPGCLVDVVGAKYFLVVGANYS